MSNKHELERRWRKVDKLGPPMRTLEVECACGSWKSSFCDCSGLRWRVVSEWLDMYDYPGWIDD